MTLEQLIAKAKVCLTLDSGTDKRRLEKEIGVAIGCDINDCGVVLNKGTYEIVVADRINVFLSYVPTRYGFLFMQSYSLPLEGMGGAIGVLDIASNSFVGSLGEPAREFASVLVERWVGDEKYSRVLKLLTNYLNKECQLPLF